MDMYVICTKICRVLLLPCSMKMLRNTDQEVLALKVV